MTWSKPLSLSKPWPPLTHTYPALNGAMDSPCPLGAEEGKNAMGMSHVVAPPKPGNTTNMVGICSRLRINELQISLSSIAVARPLTSVVPRYFTLKSWAGLTRGRDVHRSNSLWLPSNGKPIPVDILICQNVFFFTSTMEPISSYARRKKISSAHTSVHKL